MNIEEKTKLIQSTEIEIAGSKEEIQKLVEDQKSLERDQSLADDQYKYVVLVYTLVVNLFVKPCP